jgi:hypothetical protein
MIALLKALLASGCMWGYLRSLDALTGVSFSDDVLPKILEGNTAVADYYGKRFMGSAIIFFGAFFLL